MEVRTKTLALAMDLVTTRTIEEMVQLLKKEVLRTAGGEHEDAGRYRQLLIRTLHTCSMKFADVAVTVIPVLTDFLSESNEAAATDLLVFIREAIQRFENLRPLIVEKLLEVRTQCTIKNTIDKTNRNYFETNFDFDKLGISSHTICKSTQSRTLDSRRVCYIERGHRNCDGPYTSSIRRVAIARSRKQTSSWRKV